MTIWDICIRRPVFTVVLVLAPIVLGTAAYTRLGVDLFPNVDLPIVSVTTTLRGASVEEMESGITKPIEEIVNTISGIDELSSTTREGYSQVVLQFVLEKMEPSLLRKWTQKYAPSSANCPRVSIRLSSTVLILTPLPL